VFGGSCEHAHFLPRGNFAVVERKGLKDTKSTHRSHDIIFLATAEGP
jgi:hypothetical protein